MRNQENMKLVDQSVKLFKNWFKKHPYIKFNGNDNLDDIFLHYLRVKKFNMNSAYKCFETHISFIKSHPKWHEAPTAADYKFIYGENSPFLPIKRPDDKGRKFLIYKMRHFNGISDYNKIVRKSILPALFQSFSPEVEKNGVIFIVDFRDVCLSTVSKIPISAIRDIFKLSNNGPSRVHKIILLGMPSYVEVVYGLVKNLLSTKMSSRMILLQNVSDLHKFVNVSILPKDYDGTSTCELEDLSVLDAGIDYVKLLNKFEVDTSKTREFEAVGSFRQLLID